MRKFFITYIPASIVLAFLAMIFLTYGGGSGGGISAILNDTAIAADSAHRGSIPIKWNVAGTIVIVPLPDPSGPPAYGLIQANVKGAPGKAQFTVLGIPGPPQDSLDECDGGPGYLFSPNDMVITFEDLSMLFAQVGPDGGWACFQNDGTLTAVANMSIIGGTAKYQDASGWIIGKFRGQQVGMSGLLQAETGTIEGQIVWDD